MAEVRTSEPYGNPGFLARASEVSQAMLAQKLGDGFAVCEDGAPGSFEFHTLLRKTFGETGVDEHRASYRIRPAA